MFETLEDLRERPPVKKWQVVFVLFLVFLLGAELGILIGRRNWYWDSWLRLAANFLILLAVGKPVFKALLEVPMRQHHENGR